MRTRTPKSPSVKPLLMSIEDGGRALGLGRSSIYALLRTGELQGVHVLKRHMLTVGSVEQLATPGPQQEP